MTAVVIGGSSGLGRALCEELAARKRNIVIAASGGDDCRRLANHLHLLHGIAATPVELDARAPAHFTAALVDALADVGTISDLFLPIGAAHEVDRVGDSDRTMEDLWAINYGSVVAAIEQILPMLRANGGRIVGFGSIAAVRARNNNVQYAAAKSALAAYFEALRQALSSTPHVAQFYVVGYVESGQSFGKTQLFPVMPAHAAALRVIADDKHDFGCRFLPRWWAIPAMILKLLPWQIFSRLRF